MAPARQAGHNAALAEVHGILPQSAWAPRRRRPGSYAVLGDLVDHIVLHRHDGGIHGIHLVVEERPVGVEAPQDGPCDLDAVGVEVVGNDIESVRFPVVLLADSAVCMVGDCLENHFAVFPRAEDVWDGFSVHGDR